MDHAQHMAGRMEISHLGMEESFRRRFWLALFLTALISGLSSGVYGSLGFDWATPGVFADVIFLLVSAVAVYAALPFYIGAISELKEKNYGMMTLVSVAVGSGYLYSAASTFIFKGSQFYLEVATLVTVLLFGHWMEMRAVRTTGNALKELTKLIPLTAHLLKGLDVVDVKTEELTVGQRVLVKPGEKVPADGVVVDGLSSVNEAMITGEFLPVLKKSGDKVSGGTINNDGALTVEVKKTGKETTLAQIMILIEQAQSSKPETQTIANRAANILTIAAVDGGILTFFVWALIGGSQGLVFALTLAITVIVTACPHALGLAIPTVTTIASSLAAKNGILIKNMKALETANKLDYIVFDKTGTLTYGVFGVKQIEAFGGDKDEVLRLAAAADFSSQHPIAKAIVKEAKEAGLKFEEAKGFRSIAGQGVEAEVAGKKVLVGNKELMKGLKLPDFYSVDQTLVWVAANNKIIGVIGLADVPRKYAKVAIETLKSLGIKVAMLTGDNRATAEAVASDLKMDLVFSEVLPEDKVNKIKELQKEGNLVAMVGDGINDAPSLAQANIGIAIGAGTDVAIDSAEIILVKSDLEDVIRLLKLAKRTTAKMVQNLVWAAGYNVVAIPVAAGVLYPWGILLKPEWGALLMSASSIIVVLNALMLYWRGIKD